jgi:Na+-transporting methylmalonyl-CoA/oxaloacetate decarboxylase gamma subunit
MTSALIVMILGVAGLFVFLFFAIAAFAWELVRGVIGERRSSECSGRCTGCGGCVEVEHDS